jgi:DNA polymerase-3 subunit beta
LRFSISQSTLLPALATVARLVPSRPVRPILSAVHVHAAAGAVTLTATDLEAAAMTTVPADVEEEGSAALPSRYLQEVIRRIPTGPVLLTSLPSAAGARILWEKSQFTIHGFAPDEFPSVPTFPPVPERTLTQAALRHAILHTAFAAAQNDPARALLSGVELRFRDNALFALATDGFQVAAYATHPAQDRPADSGTVVPAVVLQEVARALADSQETCDVARLGNRLLFRSGSTCLVTRILEGRYFAVLDMVPKEFPTVVQLSREAFTGACERVGLISDSEAPYPLTLSVTDGAVRVAAQSPDVGEAEEELSAEVAGPPLTIGFNGRQLLQGLRHFDGQVLRLELSGPATLARLMDRDDPRLQFMQMPLQMEAEE